MRPAVVELRQGILFWMLRADFTQGKWADTMIGINRPYHEVKEDLSVCYPTHLVDWPEAKGQHWEDA